MEFSLWRGDHALGQIHLREPFADEQVAGVLLLEPGAQDLQGMMQTRLATTPGGPVFQSPIEPDIVAERLSRPSNSRSGPVALRRLSEEEAQGVPREGQLRIRDQDGAELSTRLIMLQETRLSPDAPMRDIAKLPQGAVVRGSVWSVLALIDTAEPSA